MLTAKVDRVVIQHRLVDDMVPFAIRVVIAAVIDASGQNVSDDDHQTEKKTEIITAMKETMPIFPAVLHRTTMASEKFNWERGSSVPCWKAECILLALSHTSGLTSCNT